MNDASRNSRRKRARVNDGDEEEKRVRETTRGGTAAPNEKQKVSFHEEFDDLPRDEDEDVEDESDHDDEVRPHHPTATTTRTSASGKLRKLSQTQALGEIDEDDDEANNDGNVALASRVVRETSAPPAVNPSMKSLGFNPATQGMIEVILNDRLGKKIRVKCNLDDTVGDLKKVAALQVGANADKMKIQKWYTVFKNDITLADYEIKNGMSLELYYN